jgi:hypothetical protein
MRKIMHAETCAIRNRVCYRNTVLASSAHTIADVEHTIANFAHTIANGARNSNKQAYMAACISILHQLGASLCVFVVILTFFDVQECLLPLNPPGHGDRSVLLNGAYIDTITTPVGNYGIINMPSPPEEVDDGIAAYRWAFLAIRLANATLV